MEDYRHPKKCNVCGSSRVYLIDNKILFGRKVGSGLAYFCRDCGAWCGTHRNNPDCAYGILMDDETHELMSQCQSLRVRIYGDSKHSRFRCRRELEERFGFSRDRSEFSMMDTDMLKKCLEFLGGKLGKR